MICTCKNYQICYNYLLYQKNYDFSIPLSADLIDVSGSDVEVTIKISYTVAYGDKALASTSGRRLKEEIFSITKTFELKNINACGKGYHYGEKRTGGNVF